MESTPENSTAGYLVHQEGQALGPFTRPFLAAMALGGVFKPGALVESAGNGTRMSLQQACGSLLNPLPEIPVEEEPYNAFHEWLRERRGILIAAGLVVFGMVALVLWSSHNNRPISSPALPPYQPTNQYPSTSTPWPTTSVPSLPPPPSLPASYLSPPPATSPPSPPPYTATPPVTPPAASQSQVYKDANGHTYSVSNADYYRLVGRQTLLDQSRKEIDAREAEYDALEAEVDRDRASLDRSSQFAVDRFNEKINRLNAMSDRLKSLVDSFNFSVNSFNAELERVGRRIN